MSGRRGRSDQGQSVVEFAILIPLFLMILLGMLEYGLMFNRHITMQFATREGARTGAALANGGGPLGCGGGQSPNAATVDRQIIAATERVLKAAGSTIDLSLVSQIRIYKAATNGRPTGTQINVWVYAPGAGPVVDGQALDFRPLGGSQGWLACSRDNGASPDSVGVALTYSYVMATPLANLLGVSSLTINDATIMALNPTGA